MTHGVPTISHLSRQLLASSDGITRPTTRCRPFSACARVLLTTEALDTDDCTTCAIRVQVRSQREASQNGHRWTVSRYSSGGPCATYAGFLCSVSFDAPNLSYRLNREIHTAMLLDTMFRSAQQTAVTKNVSTQC